MKNKKKFFYLDFDGVIADSIKECIDTSFETWTRSNKKLVNNFNDDYYKNFKDLVTENAIKFRYLVNPPEHYFCLIDLLAKDLIIKNQKITKENVENLFLKKVESENLTNLKIFKKNFFLVRKERFKHNPKLWLQENPSTKFFDTFLDICYKTQHEIIIISRKDEESITNWIDQKKIKISNIFGNESLLSFDNSKFNLIKKLQIENKFKSGFFIDDSLEEINHKDWSSISISPIFAGWGYNDRKDNTKKVLNRIRKEI